MAKALDEFGRRMDPLVRGEDDESREDGVAPEKRQQALAAKALHEFVVPMLLPGRGSEEEKPQILFGTAVLAKRFVQRQVTKTGEPLQEIVIEGCVSVWGELDRVLRN